ncbi:MAG: RNA polymerase sigma factor [Saprospiraceae bacterium]
MKSPDLVLLNLCMEGDRRALYDLYSACNPALLSICRRYIRDEADAASELNEGFMKILKGLPKFNTNQPFEPWIKRIMINHLIDRHRKIKQDPLYQAAPIQNGENENYNPIAENDVNVFIESEVLSLMLAKLPPMGRKVFNLFAIDGFSHQEVGQLLGISEGTSKWHLSDARQRLRKQIEQFSSPISIKS